MSEFGLAQVPSLSSERKNTSDEWTAPEAIRRGVRHTLRLIAQVVQFKEHPKMHMLLINNFVLFFCYYFLFHITFFVCINLYSLIWVDIFSFSRFVGLVLSADIFLSLRCMELWRLIMGAFFVW